MKHEPRAEPVDPIAVARTQRQMLTGLAALILATPILASVYPWLQESPALVEIGQGSFTRAQLAVVAVQAIAVAAFMVPAFRLIGRIGWSAANQLVFVVICIASYAASPLLLIALFFINRDANRVLRDHGIEPGLLGVPRRALARFENGIAA